ncbi:MAG: hypothetical protein CBC85_001690 [Hyphomonadaceae bacterium TMED125]|nr:MAG: hypothetical protein CBC85_001690 [Hyphomonadaceae bacterium TMED125]
MQMPAKRGTTPIAGILLGGISLLVLAGCVQTETASSDTVDTSVAETVAMEARVETPHPGALVYQERCADCHDAGGDLRMPSLADLQNMSGPFLRYAVTQGKMRDMATGLNRTQIADLIDYLSPASETGTVVSEAAQCESTDIDFDTVHVGSWGVTTDNQRYFSSQSTSLTAENVDGLELAWAFGMPGTSDMRSYPVVTEDTIFTAATSGHLFAIDRQSGCIKWHNQTERPMRSAVSLGEVGGAPAIFVMDAIGTVHAYRGETGEALWSTEAALFNTSMGTGGVVPAGDRLIVPMSNNDAPRAMDPRFECCKGHGGVHALDMETGEILWTTHMTPDAEPIGVSSVGTQQWGPSGAPVWATPAVDLENGRVYIGTGENTSLPATETSDALIALDLETGEMLWVYQAWDHDTWNMSCSAFRPDGPNCPTPEGPDYDFGGGVTFTQLSDGREVVVAGQKSGDVHVVDAETGELVWTRKISAGSALGGVHWGVTVSNGRVYAPAADPEFPMDPAEYNPQPGLYVLDLDTGDMLWSVSAERGCDITYAERNEQTEPWPDCSFSYGYSATPASTDELVVIGALDGNLFIFNAETGERLWEYDTVREFETVNGISAHGGAIDNAGPFLAGDMLYVQSGYSGFSQMPGNALLAFRLTGKEE